MLAILIISPFYEKVTVAIAHSRTTAEIVAFFGKSY